MGKTFKRRAIKQHKDLLEDGQYRPKTEPNRKKHLTKREIDKIILDDMVEITREMWNREDN